MPGRSGVVVKFQINGKVDKNRRDSEPRKRNLPGYAIGEGVIFFVELSACFSMTRFPEDYWRFDTTLNSEAFTSSPELLKFGSEVSPKEENHF